MRRAISGESKSLSSPRTTSTCAWILRHICQRSSALNSALPLSAPPAPGRLGPASLLGGVPCLAGARLWLPSHVLAKRLVVLPCQAAVRELAQVVLDPLAEHPV